MDDKFKEGFDRMLTGAPEGPSWDQVSTPAASEERPQPTRQRRALVGIGAFVLTVFVIGAVAFLATRDQGAPFAGDTTTTSSASALSETERSSIATWVNGVGLTQVDESVWRRRFDTMCTEGVWHVDVAVRLADEYIAADIAAGLLSVSAPLARALIGKSVGDIAEVVTPGGHKDYEVIKISYK